MKKIKILPKFKNEDEEAKFWNTHDSSLYVDWNKAYEVEFPNLKPSTKTITLRLPIYLLNSLKEWPIKRIFLTNL
jgi:hypothetical protein